MKSLSLLAGRTVHIKTIVLVLVYCNRLPFVLAQPQVLGQLYWSYNTNTVIYYFNFLLTVKAVTLIFISGCGSAISSAKEGKSGFIYNLIKSE